ncbi:hypothetical protein [Roseivirga pacifica]|uniref:hypothetical protein n=1 Tax=Roseivirga pacifica TaxID=1267423 RepID=UPI00227B4492|nr:hypothetical protein [Roseivirga pacifica]
MKKYSYLLALLLFVGLSSAYAQRGQGGRRQQMDPEKVAKQRADMWQEEFGLSDEQHEKVQAVLVKNIEETQEKMQSLRGSGDRAAMQKGMEEVRESLEKELKTIFTETQWTAYEKWKKENPPMQRRRGGGGQ